MLGLFAQVCLWLSSGLGVLPLTPDDCVCALALWALGPLRAAHVKGPARAGRGRHTGVSPAGAPPRAANPTLCCCCPPLLQIHGLPTLIFVGMDANKPALRTEGLLPAQVRDRCCLSSRRLMWHCLLAALKQARMLACASTQCRCNAPATQVIQEIVERDLVEGVQSSK